jgi:hypothetical protein
MARWPARKSLCRCFMTAPPERWRSMEAVTVRAA